MLATPSKSIDELRGRFGERRVTCEYKYDGERAQIHFLSLGAVRLFSRHCEVCRCFPLSLAYLLARLSQDSTARFPDVVASVADWLVPLEPAGELTFILDAEVCAFDRKTECILPFQVLSGRAKKVAFSSS